MKKFISPLILFCLILGFSQPAFAGICGYSGGQAVLAEPCVQPGGDGQDCRPNGWFYKGSCVYTDIILAESATCFTKSRKFDGITGCTSQCTATNMCMKPDGTCITATDPLGCNATYHRVLNCDGTCGAKLPGYEYCDTTAGATGCSPTNPDYGFVCQTKLCATAGKSTLDYCTGSCTSCTGDYVEFPEGSGSCVLPTKVVYSDDTFYGWIGSAWRTISESVINQITETIEYINELKEALQPEFLGVSNTAFTVAANYATVNGYCSTITVPTNGAAGTESQTDTGAHVCDASEIIGSYNSASAAIGYMTTNTAMPDVALINNGPPGYTSWSNDCAGWTNVSGTIGANTVYGSVWFFTNKFGSLNKCSDIKTNNVRFACCK